MSAELQRELELALGGKQPRLRAWSGVLTDAEGTGTAAVAGRANYVYVAQPDGAVIQVYNGRVPPTPNRVVMVGYDPLNPRFLQVLSFRRAYAGGESGNIELPLHAPLHEYLGTDAVDIDARQFTPLRVTLASGFTVSVSGTAWVEGGWLEISEPLDLTALVPGADAIWVLIYLDTAGAVNTRTSSAEPLAALTQADIPALGDGERGLAAVRLYDGQTEIREDTASQDVVDLRFAGATPAPPEGVDIASDEANIVAVNFIEQSSNPAAPGAGHRIIFSKSDGIYIKDAAGTVIGPLTTSRWEPLTNGDSTTPEILFHDGDVLVGEIT